jgi:D-alanine-D-alanine ligase
VRKLRVLVLMHEDLVPPEDPSGLDPAELRRHRTEREVMETLAAMGHRPRALGVRDELTAVRTAVEEWRPHIVFNLLEEFHGEAVYDHNVVAYLELLRVPYTGCDSRALVLARDKALAKKIVSYHRVRTPRFAVFRRGRRARRPRALRFPLIVKSLWEDASLGIAKASVVTTDEKLAERVALVHERVGTDAIAEEFVIGRELYVSVLGNERLETLTPIELRIEGGSSGPLVATARIKHDRGYQDRSGAVIETVLELDPALETALERQSRRVYRALHLCGYGRIDFRLDEQGRLFFLEANPNPEIARDEEFATAAESVGYSYEALLQRILNLGLRRARSAPGAGA